jgi:hypothetical protein
MGLPGFVMRSLAGCGPEGNRCGTPLGNLILKDQFSASYSLRKEIPWLTEPVTKGRSRAHLLFLMLSSILIVLPNGLTSSYKDTKVEPQIL